MNVTPPTNGSKQSLPARSDYRKIIKSKIPLLQQAATNNSHCRRVNSYHKQSCYVKFTFIQKLLESSFRFHGHAFVSINDVAKVTFNSCILIDLNNKQNKLRTAVNSNNKYYFTDSVSNHKLHHQVLLLVNRTFAETVLKSFVVVCNRMLEA